MILTYTADDTYVSPIFIITAFVSLGLIAKLIYTIFKDASKDDWDKVKSSTSPQNNNPSYNPNMNMTYAFSYMKVPLLTKREWKQYHILKEITDQKNLIICPKVRLLDLVVPRPGFRNTRGLKARVMSKHVDFVICDTNMEVVAIIELDDSTHFRPDRKKRDNFVDGVLFGAGYRVIHTWAITSDILDFLN